jgi:hypothetical protein
MVGNLKSIPRLIGLLLKAAFILDLQWRNRTGPKPVFLVLIFTALRYRKLAISTLTVPTSSCLHDTDLVFFALKVVQICFARG